jgi:ADP-ribose pyrophosphatase
MITVIDRMGKAPARLEYEDFRLERKGFLSIISYAIKGYAHRFDVMERGHAVVIMPVDFTSRSLYMLTELRPNRPLGIVGRGREIIRNLLDGSSEPSARFDVPASDARMYEFCAGMIDADKQSGELLETPSEAAKRELREETGLRIDDIQLVHVASYFPSVGGSTEIVHLFIADLAENHAERRDSAKGDGGEEIEVLTMSWDDAYGLLKAGKIGSSSAGLLLRELKIMDLEGRKPQKW